MVNYNSQIVDRTYQCLDLNLGIYALWIIYELICLLKYYFKYLYIYCE